MLNNFLGRFFRKAWTIFRARVKNELFIKKRCIWQNFYEISFPQTFTLPKFFGKTEKKDSQNNWQNPTMRGINKRSYNFFVANLNFYNDSTLKESLIWREKRWTFFRLQRKKTLASVFWNKHQSALLTSNELLCILTKANNQFNEKMADTMFYKICTYIHTHTHTCIYTILLYITIKAKVCFSINI